MPCYMGAMDDSTIIVTTGGSFYLLADLAGNPSFIWICVVLFGHVGWLTLWTYLTVCEYDE